MVRQKTYHKVIARTIRQTLSRFLAIFAIVALGVGFLAGLLATTPDMRYSGDRYFDTSRLFDVRVVGTLGLTDADAEALRAVDGVEEVMPAYSADLLVGLPGGDTVVGRFHSLPLAQAEAAQPQNYLNRVEIAQGRLPVRADECVVEQGTLSSSSVHVGDTITVSPDNANAEDTLARSAFKVVGIVHSSYYFSLEREPSSVGTGTLGLILYTGSENFTLEAYTDLYAALTGARDKNSLTDAYDDFVDETVQRIKDISGARCEVRLASVRATAQDKLADATADYESAKAEADQKLADAQKKLDDGWAEVADSEAKLRSAQQQIDSGTDELQANREALPGMLAEKQQELSAGQAALNTAKAEYESGMAQLALQRQALAEAKQQLEAARQGRLQLQNGIAQAQAALPGLTAQAAALDTAAAAAEQSYSSAQSGSNVALLKSDAEAKQAVLTAAQTQLEAKQAALAAAQAALAANPADAALQAALTAAQSDCDSALTARDAARSAADAALGLYTAEQARLDALQAAAVSARAQADSAQKMYAATAASLDSSRTQLAAVESAIAENEPKIAVGEAQLAAGEQKLAGAAAQLAAAEKQLADGQEALSLAPGQAEVQFDLAQEKLDDARAKLADGRAKLSDAKKKLADGQAEYDEQKQNAQNELDDARRQLDEAQDKIDALEAPEWYVLTRSTNVSFMSFRANVQKVEAVAKVFPIFFFLVAALVALTTMTRMVEEERLQIGTLKALGYSKGSIIWKYVLYALAASVSGSVFGFAVGFVLFPTVIWNAYTMMYTLPKLYCLFNVPLAVVSSAAAILCTLAATLSACWATLAERPAQLMLPRAPKAGKRILLEHITPVWSRLKFTHKVTARNLFLYKKRFFMTIIGISGCTALLVTGFGLHDSISDIVNKQFGDIFTYNVSVTLKNEAALDGEDLRAVLSDPASVTGYLPVHQEKSVNTFGSDSFNTYLLVPQDVSRLSEFVDLHTRQDHTPVAAPAEGIVITEKMAERMHASIGHTIELENSDHQKAVFTVSGIVENYVENYVYMTPETYRAGYGEAPEFNMVLARGADDSRRGRDALGTALLAADGVSSVNFVSDLKESFTNMMQKIDTIVVVIIVCAGALAFIVLYNLTNINITERVKEIATIKVLGFYDKEVAAYVYRESIALSVMGTAVGLVLGIFLHMFVVHTVEVDAVMFGRTIKPLSYVYSAALTMVFSALVNLVMHRKLQKISMVESMKAPE